MSSKIKMIPRTTPIEELPLTVPVPVGGDYFYGLNRGQSYRAAKSGALVTVETGPNRFQVSVPATYRKIQQGSD